MKKAKIKEFFRKFIVSLKRRPHNIPLVFMLITYCVFAFNLSNVSHATAVVNITPMGLCSFIAMLAPLLGFVTFLNAFPVRQKVKIPFLVLLFAIQILIFVVDIIYANCIANGLDMYPEILGKQENWFIVDTYYVVIVHMVLVGISTLLIATIPVYGKLLNKINTSINVESGASISNLELDNSEN